MTTSENPVSWQWLANTYWYVPAPYLAAQRFDSDSSSLTPTGQVQLTFVPSGEQGAATVGFGHLVRRGEARASEPSTGSTPRPA